MECLAPSTDLDTGPFERDDGMARSIDAQSIDTQTSHRSISLDLRCSGSGEGMALGSPIEPERVTGSNPASPSGRGPDPLAQDPVLTAETVSFLTRYGFELGSSDLGQQVNQWQQDFPSPWIPAAVLEALGQGRYKVASIQHILVMWRRRGWPRVSFDPEFCQRLWPEQIGAIRAIRRHHWEIHQAPSISMKLWPEPEGSDPSISTRALCSQLQINGIPPRLQRLLQARLLPQHPEPDHQSPEQQDSEQQDSERVRPERFSEIFIDLGSSPPQVLKGSLALEKISHL